MDKAHMLKQIKEYYKFRSDAEFARFLGITPQNLKHWLTRNTFDISILATKCNDINSDWLLTGEGDMLKKPKSPTEDPMQNVSDIISMPREVWEVIRDQAASLKAKDQQMSEVIALLKKEINKKGGAADAGGAAGMAALG